MFVVSSQNFYYLNLYSYLQHMIYSMYFYRDKNW